MIKRAMAAFLATAFLCLQALPGSAVESNPMGYRLLSAGEAATLPRNGGKLGMQVGPAQTINSGGMTFELLRVNGVSPGSPGARAGLAVGDQIIAVDGRVFANVAAFAAYIGSMQPASQIAIDYMPASGGPQQAQRVDVRLSGSQPASGAPQTGLFTGAKVAIGAGAIVLFGCYKLGCFSHKAKPSLSGQ